MQDSPYIAFSGQQWQQYRADTPLTLSEHELQQLRGFNEKVSLDEVEQIYLPLSRLLNLYVKATASLYQATEQFLGHGQQKVPYIIGVAGSVAVGKSTTSRLLQVLLQRWPSHPKVDLVTTDGFLYPNSVLEKNDLMMRKGFPESYDQKRLIKFLADLKSGKSQLKVPLYSHLTYDILPDEYQTIDQPDVIIIEGLNILQADIFAKAEPTLFVSDFFDFSIYVHAEAGTLRQWFLQRFHLFRQTAFTNPDSFFHRFCQMDDDEAHAFANQVWQDINEVNLNENILPTKSRAHLILEKGVDHSVESVLLRKL